MSLLAAPSSLKAHVMSENSASSIRASCPCSMSPASTLPGVVAKTVRSVVAEGLYDKRMTYTMTCTGTNRHGEPSVATLHSKLKGTVRQSEDLRWKAGESICQSFLRSLYNIIVSLSEYLRLLCECRDCTGALRCACNVKARLLLTSKPSMPRDWWKSSMVG
jgi:hypothetical protein